MNFLPLFTAMLLAPLTTLRAEDPDVIVYGSTPGGFCAAIAAAREGASVILLEPTDHVGGVNTGGLSFSDSNQTVRATVMGLFDEWHRRIEADYTSRGIKLPYKVGEKDHTHWTYEPGVAMRITRQMLDEAKVRVLTKHVLKSVTKDGARITRLKTSDGEFSAKVFIDASYEGDLMAVAGVSWTIGREERNEFGESLAGKQYPKPSMPVSGRDDKGGLLPLVTTDDAGPDDSGDKNVMVYSFRLCLTKDPAKRVPFPAPAHYDPARFELIRRHFSQGKATAMWDLYPLPGGKFDANNGIWKQFSMGLIGAGNDWCEADGAGRARIWEEHKQYTLELYHFFRTDPSVPGTLRKQHAELGLCRDEFAGTGHWSPQLYVREGRRMKGMYVISQKDIMENPRKDDPIVISSFPIDSHDCQRVATKNGVINEGTIMPARMPGRKHGYIYHIPYRSILPPAAECDNLLVPVALSCTHVGISSIRVEPTWMILGQSAGVAAALSASQNLSVQKLPYPTLRERLLAQKQVLEIPKLAGLPTPQSTDAPSPPVKPNILWIVMDDVGAELPCYGEKTIQTPFIVRGPGIARGTVRTDLIEHIDMAATSLARAGLPVPSWMQGRDIFARDYIRRDAVFAARDRCDETVDRIRSVRTEQFKYIRNFHPRRPMLQPNDYKDTKPTLKRLRELHAQDKLSAMQEELLFSPTRPAEELYDVRADPFEIRNLAGDTLVIFTSDNGPTWYEADVQRLGHASAGGWRGMKSDAWEGGHRMPFIVRWPGRVKAGSVSGQTICFTDLLATFAEICGAALPNDAGPDSFSFLPVLAGVQPADKPIRAPIVMQAGSAASMMMIRSGDWKLINGLGSGGFTKPSSIKPKSGEPSVQLYNLRTDPARAGGQRRCRRPGQAAHRAAHRVPATRHRRRL